MEGEDILKFYNCEEGCSKCCGPKTHIVLTNQRVISRREDAGCCTSTHYDSAIFLQDIEVMREVAAGTNSCWVLIVACVTCQWPCLLCAMCCGSCCGDKPKKLEFVTGGTSENLTFRIEDASMAAVDITRASLAAKNGKSRH